MIVTDYDAHEAEYQRRKSRGYAGWSSQQDRQRDLDLYQRVLQRAYVPEQGRLLEIGCGAGDLAIWFAQAKGYEVFGVDVSPTAVAWAQEKAAASGLKADFCTGSVLDLKDYSDGFFDVVIDGHCLHCIIGKDRTRCLASVWRVLRPGGFFHVNTMCGDPADEELLKRFDPHTRCVMRQGPRGWFAERYMGLPGDVLGELKGAGFEIRHFEVTEGGDSDLLADALKPDKSD